MTPTPKHGFELAWCANAKLDESGSIIPSQCEFQYLEFTTLSSAKRRAKMLLPKDFFGAIQIREFEDTYRAPFARRKREYLGDVVEVSE